MKLKGKVVIVTGASDGLGRQIALKLAKKGVNLALLARDETRLQKVSKEARKLGAPRVNYYTCDLRDRKQIEKSAKAILNDFKDINILINNAGIWHKRGQLEEINEGLIEEIIRVNLTAVIELTRFLLPSIKQQKDAAIINISSRSGIRVAEGQSVYSASKWGIRGFTEVLKVDLVNTNVRVAAIYQAGVRTKLFEKAEEVMPTEKYIEPSDLADIIVFMLSRPPKIWLHDVRVEY